MRVVVLITCAVTLAWLPAPLAQCQDKADRKAAPTDKELTEFVGGRMSKLFPKFGYPADVFLSDTSSDRPSVFLDYGSYGFKVRNKVVDVCMIFNDWKGTVYGAKMGDSQDDTLQKLGKPKTTAKGKDGLPYMIWSFKDWDGTLEFDFDKDNKLYRAVIED